MVRSQHEEEVEELYENFEDVIGSKQVRWDDVRRNQQVVLEDGRSTDADVVLFNEDDMEVLSIEVKTSVDAVGKAGRQMDKVEEFYEEQGYQVRTRCHVVERDDHMAHDEFVETVLEDLEEPFSKRDLETVIEYSRSWATFGCLYGQGVVKEKDQDAYVLDESAYQEFWGSAAD